jgi:hypothetical protein
LQCDLKAVGVKFNVIAIDFAKEHGEDEDDSEEVSEPEP